MCRILTRPTGSSKCKIQIQSDTTQQNVQWEIYYPRRQIVMSVRANFADIYLRGMRDRRMRSETELTQEIQLTDWSTAGEQGKLVFVVSITPSLAQFISLFTLGKNRFSIVQITHLFKFFTSRFLSRKNVEKKFVVTNNFCS